MVILTTGQKEQTLKVYFCAIFANPFAGINNFMKMDNISVQLFLGNPHPSGRQTGPTLEVRPSITNHWRLRESKLSWSTSSPYSVIRCPTGRLLLVGSYSDCIWIIDQLMGDLFVYMQSFNYLCPLIFFGATYPSFWTPQGNISGYLWVSTLFVKVLDIQTNIAYG